MSIERAIVSAMKQADRNSRQMARARQQEYNRQQKLQAKYDKENYIESRYAEAEEKTKELIEEYNKFDDLISDTWNNDQFSFEKLKKEYIPRKYVSRYSKPIKETSNGKITIPEESWLEKVFPGKKAKRINLQNEKIKMDEDFEEKYKKNLEQYEINIEKEKIEWEKGEKISKEKIDTDNYAIDKWKQNCIECDEESIKKLIIRLLENNNYSKGTVIGKNVAYNKNVKKVIINLYVDLKENIFEYEGYKYVKQRDMLEPVNMKVGTSNQRMRDLMINLCLATFIQIFKNDITESISEVVLNIFHNRVCCISGKITKDEYNDFKFNDEDDIVYIENHFLRIYKQITTGVKPIDELYQQLS